MTGDLNDLTDEQKYVVTRLRECVAGIRQNRDNDLYLVCDSRPICTWSTLFALLGREVVQYIPSDKAWHLVPDWHADAP